MELKIELVVNGNVAANTIREADTLEEYGKILRSFGFTTKAAERIKLQRTQVCKNCGKKFLKTKASQIFCCKKCKNTSLQRVFREKHKKENNAEVNTLRKIYDEMHEKYEGLMTRLATLHKYGCYDDSLRHRSEAVIWCLNVVAGYIPGMENTNQEGD